MTPFGESRLWWLNITEIFLNMERYGYEVDITLAQDKVECWTFVGNVTKLHVAWNVRSVLNSWVTVSFSEHCFMELLRRTDSGYSAAIYHRVSFIFFFLPIQQAAILCCLNVGSDWFPFCFRLFVARSDVIRSISAVLGSCSFVLANQLGEKICLNADLLFRPFLSLSSLSYYRDENGDPPLPSWVLLFSCDIWHNTRQQNYRAIFPCHVM